MKFARIALIAVSALSFTAPMAFAKGEKAKCWDASGQEVAGVAKKKDCKSPNKWAKNAPKAANTAPAAAEKPMEAPKTEAAPAGEPAK